MEQNRKEDGHFFEFEKLTYKAFDKTIAIYYTVLAVLITISAIMRIINGNWQFWGIDFVSILVVFLFFILKDKFQISVKVIFSIFPPLSYTALIAIIVGADKLQLVVLLLIVILSFYVASFYIQKKIESMFLLLLKKYKEECDYNFLFNNTSDGLLIANSKGVISKINENFTVISGYEIADVLGKNISEFMVNEELMTNPIRLDLLRMGQTLISERSAIAKDGSIKFLEIKAKLLSDGRVQFFIRDKTEQRHLEQEIEVERSFIKAIIDTMPGIFYVFEDYNKLVQWNDSLENITGYTHDELFNISPEQLFDKTDRERIENGLNQALNEGYAYFKAKLLTKSGQSIPLYQTAVDNHRSGKRFLVGVGYDISSFELTEAALKDSEENFKNIYNNTSDAIFIFNQDFEILSANQTFFSITGLTEDDLKRLNIFDFIFDENALQKVAREIKELDGGRTMAAEYLVQNKDGRRFPVEVRSRGITYEGKPAVVTSFNDISSRKDLEKQVYIVSVKAEEEERGRIAKDLHDGLGPLLSTCKIYLHNIKNAAFKPVEKKSFVKLGELINESLIGVKEISNNLSPHILRNFGLIPALTSFLEKLSAYAKIRINCNFNAPHRYNEIVEITLYRVATELLNNTIKHSEAENVFLSVLEQNDKLIFEYSDDGKGFDYEGTIDQNKGLGLFNINSRINSIGGIIIFKSSIGKGVHVIIETNIIS